MALRRPSGSDDDDGFGDFLSEDEEECALRTQEMAALARKMKTVGVREAIELGKESSLQEGFDAGFNTAARDAFRFGALRGALCVAVASGLSHSLQASEAQELSICIEELRVRSLRVPRVAVTTAETIVDGAVGSTDSPEPAVDESNDTALIERARQWMGRLRLPIDSVLVTNLALG